jgi:hypothetical protein
MIDELGWIRKEEFVAYFNVMFTFAYMKREDLRNTSGYLASGTKTEPGVSIPINRAPNQL